MSNEYKTKHTIFFLFLFFFVFVFVVLFFVFCFFFFCAEQPNRPNATLAQFNRKKPQTSKPKWSPQPKNPGSKPIGGIKGMKNLTGSSGMRARHHHSKGDKSEMNGYDKN